MLKAGEKNTEGQRRRQQLRSERSYAEFFSYVNGKRHIGGELTIKPPKSVNKQTNVGGLYKQRGCAMHV